MGIIRNAKVAIFKNVEERNNLFVLLNSILKKVEVAILSCSKIVLFKMLYIGNKM